MKDILDLILVFGTKKDLLIMPVILELTKCFVTLSGTLNPMKDLVTFELTMDLTLYVILELLKDLCSLSVT